MKTTWKKTSIGLVLENGSRYEEGTKTYHMNNIIENPDDAKLIAFGKAYSMLNGDKFNSVLVTKVTTVSEEV